MNKKNNSKNKNKIKYSIIIPHLNEGYYLDVMIDSFYNYVKYDNYEIIIIDDGTPNQNDLNFLNSHPLRDKIRLYTENGLGAPGARNFGANKAKGKILIFMDSHLYINTNILHYLDNNFLKNIDLLQFTISDFKNKNTLSGIYSIKDYGLSNFCYNTRDDFESGVICENPNIAGGAMVIKKKIFNNLGGFNKFFRKWGAEDIDLSMRAWLYGYKCYFTKESIVVHYWKSTFVNTLIKSDDVVFNKIIFTLTCFLNLQRRNLALSGLKEKYGIEIFNKNYQEITLNNEIVEWIKCEQKKFKYNDDWYFEKFKKYYSIFQLPNNPS